MGSARFFKNEVAVKADHSANYKRGKRSNGHSSAEAGVAQAPTSGLMLYGAVHDNHGDKMDQSKV
jgi:hypothetical protein